MCGVCPSAGALRSVRRAPREAIAAEGAFLDVGRRSDLGWSSCGYRARDVGGGGGRRVLQRVSDDFGNSPFFYMLDADQERSDRRGQLAADATHVAAAHSEFVICSDRANCVANTFLSPFYPYCSEESMRLWAQIAIKWYGIELGSDSEQVASMKAVLNAPRSHPAWGSRGHEKVRGPS